MNEIRLEKDDIMAIAALLDKDNSAKACEYAKMMKLIAANMCLDDAIVCCDDCVEYVHG